jgi:diguanylate cyclase (GGDEF)-like protein
VVVNQWYQLTLPINAMTLFYGGCAIEVMATTLGVADRFLALKQQAEHARSEAIEAGRNSESDALTGLNNRRFLDEHFDSLRREGFTSLAALDLDHFKSINDTYGHDTGDAVLRAVGKALNRVLDQNTIPVRIGGEEFALLLRGEGIRERAERYRQAIAEAVADLVDIDRPVTASMGLVEASAADVPSTDFTTLYKRADGLLYKAKEAGRNRLMAERIKAFTRPDQAALTPAAAA